MAQYTVLRGQPLSKEIPYRDPDAAFALTGSDGNGKRAYLPVGKSMVERHIFLLGGPSTGKTGMLRQLARNLRVMLTEQDCLVVLDATGESYNLLHQKGDIVLAADDRAGKTAWNIFQELPQEQDVLQEAAQLCDDLFSGRIARADNPYTETAARDLLMSLVVCLARRGDQSLKNNQALRELIEGFDVKTMLDLLDSEPELKSYRAYLQGDNEERILGVISALQKAAREIFRGQFAGKGTQSARAVVEERAGKTLFICAGLDNGLRDAACALMGQVIRCCLNQHKKAGQVYLVMDDFCALPALPYMEEAFSQGRSAGLNIVCSAPAVTAVQRAYPHGATAILGAAGTVAAFRLRDAESRRFVSELHGSCRIQESCASLAQPRNTLEQIVDAPVISDEELTTLQPGEMILTTMHYPPFRFKLKSTEK